MRFFEALAGVGGDRFKNNALARGILGLSGFADGKLLPLHKTQVLDFVSAVDDGSAVSFSDGATQGKAEWLLQFIAAQPPFVQFGAFDTGDDGPLQSTKRIDLPSGYSVDQERQSIADAATTIAADEGISFTEAVRRLGG